MLKAIASFDSPCSWMCVDELLQACGDLQVSVEGFASSENCLLGFKLQNGAVCWR